MLKDATLCLWQAHALNGDGQMQQDGSMFVILVR